MFVIAADRRGPLVVCDWNESAIKRGQPDNAGQFASKGGAKVEVKGERPSDDLPASRNIDDWSDEQVAGHLARADKRAQAMPETHLIDTPERHELRQTLARQLYNRDIENRKRDHEAVIVLGLPAAGKSTLAKPLIESMGALEVDPDLVKEQLPEYENGIGAHAVHEESSEIARRVLVTALANGDNIVWPRVDNPSKIAKDIEHLNAIGYKVHVKFLHVDPEIAKQSAIARFIKSGRYVSPAMIEEYGDKPRQAAHEARASGLAASYEEFARGPNGITKTA